MSSVKTIWLSGLILIVAALAPVHLADAAETNAKAEVMAATQQFYAALNALFEGEVKPMEDVWSHRDDVTYMGPGGGMQLGWDQVLANWQAQAAKKLGGAVVPVDMHFTIGQDLAIVNCYEVGHNIVDAKSRNVNIRATNIFRKDKDNGQWKMIGHHTDLLLFLE